MFPIFGGPSRISTVGCVCCEGGLEDNLEGTALRLAWLASSLFD